MMRYAMLGIDPGFASMGFALVSLHSSGEALQRLGVLRTQKSDKKQKVLAAHDNFRRAQELARAMREMLCAPDFHIVAICAESMSFPRSSSVAAKMAMTWGVLADITEHFDCPLLMASPQEIKKATAGAKSASKEDVQAALGARYPDLLGQLGDLPGGQHEHACDALGAVVACLNSDIARMGRKQAADAEIVSLPLT